MLVSLVFIIIIVAVVAVFVFVFSAKLSRNLQKSARKIALPKFCANQCTKSEHKISTWRRDFYDGRCQKRRSENKFRQTYARAQQHQQQFHSHAIAICTHAQRHTPEISYKSSTGAVWDGVHLCFNYAQTFSLNASCIQRSECQQSFASARIPNYFSLW